MLVTDAVMYSTFDIRISKLISNKAENAQKKITSTQSRLF